ncbi:hypothetical protein IC229_10295 [Spirosoma sp. BT702]|uniref:Uncharacterized protein n=1 Tax=Spirosoma profusum TaxID=2771354 RepID=A0A927AN34_9BACT|nr:hypothetical protein [Spirosoma profusum]MBD2701024.1 hypothetical protein [Spirosoma profusum]
MRSNVLLIGRNPSVLNDLASALTDEGFNVTTTNLVEQAVQDFDGVDFDLVAFGRGVDEATNHQLRMSFGNQNPKLIFVNGLAPLIPLLVKQIKLAVLGEQAGKFLTAFVCVSADCKKVRVNVAVSCELTIDLYELDAIHQTTQKRLISESVSAGLHEYSLAIDQNATSTIKFLAAEANELDLLVLPIR